MIDVGGDQFEVTQLIKINRYFHVDTLIEMIGDLIKR